ncbi:transposase [Actinopolyspora erythraea]|uniref:transposase n=1 Tax=Actinopolyspora erythraea TaxID=414996 RepID=UPI0038CBF47F
MGRRPTWTRRQLLDGIRWRVRDGAPWRDVPERYGHWLDLPAVSSLATGGRVALDPHDAVVLGRPGRAGRLAGIGRFHDQPSPPARRRRPSLPRGQVEPPGAEPAGHALGRSRGGFTTKIHLSCEQGRKPLSLVITAGQRGDSPQMPAVLDAIRLPRLDPGRARTRPQRVLADKAYSSRANQDYLRTRGSAATIPTPGDQAAHRRPAAPPAAATCLQTPPLPATPRRRMRHQPAHTPPGHRQPLRQTRRPLRSHPAGRHHRHLAT